MLVISPHLDDGVFGCGDLLSSHPGSTVATVFAGEPSADTVLTRWDRACGFRKAAEAIPIRRGEDCAALAVLGARQVWLEFPDAQYGRVASGDDLHSRLRELLLAQHADTIVFPLGLFHDDHRIVSETMLRLLDCHATKSWLVYADALYRFIPGLRAQRLDPLRSRGFELEPCEQHCGATQRKRDAVHCHASQLRALAGPDHVPIDTVFGPEQYWRLRRE